MLVLQVWRDNYIIEGSCVLMSFFLYSVTTGHATKTLSNFNNVWGVLVCNSWEAFDNIHCKKCRFILAAPSNISYPHTFSTGEMTLSMDQFLMTPQTSKGKKDWFQKSEVQFVWNYYFAPRHKSNWKLSNGFWILKVWIIKGQFFSGEPRTVSSFWECRVVRGLRNSGFTILQYIFEWSKSKWGKFCFK